MTQQIISATAELSETVGDLRAHLERVFGTDATKDVALPLTAPRPVAQADAIRGALDELRRVVGSVREVSARVRTI